MNKVELRPSRDRFVGSDNDWSGRWDLTVERNGFRRTAATLTRNELRELRAWIDDALEGEDDQ